MTMKNTDAIVTVAKGCGTKPPSKIFFDVTFDESMLAYIILQIVSV